MPNVDHLVLRRVTQALVEAVGTSSSSAQAVSDSLIGANLMGHDSHGVIRLPQYLESVKRGAVHPDAIARVVMQRGATAQVDGALGWGQPAARLAAQTAIVLAAENGVSAVTIINCNHIGRVGEYVETIARAGMIGIAMCNAGPAVAPYGGYQRVMGTNPFAWAAPGGPEQPPLVLDFATSGVAEGKLRVARAKGEPAPEGVLLDTSGHPSREPADFYAGGALRPFGLHKGSGMSLMIELLARGLCNVDPTQPGPTAQNGPLLIALHVPFLAPEEHFLGAAERLRDQIAVLSPAEGFDAVLLPGDLEQQVRQQRLDAGVPMPQSVWDQIVALAGEWKVAIA